MNLSRLQNIAEVTIQNNISYIRADAGAALEDIQARLRKKHLFFPVEPTENTATIGGAFACNAKGLTSLKYGSCNDHVEGIELLTADGNLLTIPRGNYFFEEDGCPLPDGGFLSCRPLPCKKERIPLLPYKGMDLIDLFAGSEGTLGILLSLNLRVIPIPPACWSLIFFFSDEKEALAFAGKLKTLPAGAGEILCAEFFDPLSGGKRGTDFSCPSARPAFWSHLCHSVGSGFPFRGSYGGISFLIVRNLRAVRRGTHLGVRLRN